VAKQSVSGQATFDVMLEDSQGTLNGGSDTSATVELIIQIQSTSFIMDFTLPPSTNITEDDPAVNLINFITDISTPAKNFADELVASVQVEDPTLFSSQPDVILVGNHGPDGKNGTASLEFTPAADKFGSSEVVVTLTVPSESFSVSKTMTITINPENDPPSFTHQTIVTAKEDSGAFVLPGFAADVSAGPGGEGTLDGQTVSFSVSCDVPSLFDVSPTVSVDGDSGELTFSLNPDENGVTTCAISLTDNGSPNEEASSNFIINVTEVNDQPSFNLEVAPDQVEDSGSITIPNFATDISAGPSNEAGQTLTFTLDCQTSLFSSPPSIDATTGDLSYTPADDLFFSNELVTVTLEDSEGGSISKTFTITILPQNDAPTFTLNSSSITDNEDDGLVEIPNFVTSFSRGPSNEASQTLTWQFSVTDESLFVKNAQGVIFTLSSGTLRYTIKPDVSGTADINITLKDNGGTANGGVDSSTQNVSYTLNAVNDPPSFTPGSSLTLDEDTALNFSSWATLINPGDPLETDTLTFSLVYNETLIESASLDSVQGTLSITPKADQFGTSSLEVTLCDEEPLCVTKTTQVQILPINDPPTFTLTETSADVVEDDGVTSISLLDSFSLGPSNEVGDVASFSVVIVSSSSPISPSPSLDAQSREFSFTRPANWFGTIEFSVELSDGTDVSGNPKTFTLNVLSRNDAPSFVLPDEVVIVNEDQSLSGYSLFTSLSPGPSNEANQNLAFIVDAVSDQGAFSTGPSVAPTGLLSFVPTLDYHGTVTFNVTLTDDGGTDNQGADRTFPPVTVTIVINSVNDVPVAEDDDAETDEDIPVEIDVLANDMDADNEPLTLVILSVSRGTAQAINNGTRIHYTPATNANGPVEIRYKAVDPSLAAAEAKVTVQVNPVNDPPTSSPSSFAVDEDQTFTGDITVYLPGNDIEGDPLTRSIASDVSHGTLNLVDDTLEYSPNSNYCGPDSFSFVVNDGEHASSSSIVTITVACVNDAPTAEDIYLTMPENTNVLNENYEFSVQASDVDGDDDLQFACTSLPSKGTVSISKDELNLVDSVSVFFTPTPWINGLDSMSCYVQDPDGLTGTFTVFLNITGPSNHVPFLLDPYVLIDTFEDTSGSYLVRGRDWDNDPLTYHIETAAGPATLCSASFNSEDSGNFSYTPLPNQNGLCSFTWYVSDGQAVSETGLVEIRFNPVNDAPVAEDVSFTVNEDQPKDYQVQASDIDMVTNSDSLTYFFASLPQHGSLVWVQGQQEPGFKYQPQPNYFGPDSFNYYVRDESAAESQHRTVSIEVINVNDPPTADSHSEITEEDTPVEISLAALVSDIDNTLSELTFTVKANRAPTKGTLVSLGSAPAGTLSPDIRYVPHPDANGADEFDFVVDDGQLKAEATISITITPVNDAPIAQNDAWVLPSNSEFEDKIRASDVDGDSLTYTITTQPQKGTLDVSNLPTIIYTATPSDDPNYEATDFFEFIANDGQVDSNVGRISIDIIKSDNQRPSATQGSFSLPEDSTLEAVLQGSDPDNDPITYWLYSDASNGHVDIQSTGDFSYVPNADFNGVDSFTFRVKDEFYFSSSVTVSITVTPANDKPEAVAISATTPEDTPITLTPIVSDIDGDSLTLDISSAPSRGTAHISGNQIVYTPNQDQTGTDQFRYIAKDQTLDSEPALVEITITPVNDPPKASSFTYTFNEDTILSKVLEASDIDSSSLFFEESLIDRNYDGVLSISGSGAFTYTPQANFHGTESFGFEVSDNHGAIDTAIITMIIKPINDAPNAQELNVEVDEDTSKDIALQGFDVDGDS